MTFHIIITNDIVSQRSNTLACIYMHAHTLHLSFTLSQSDISYRQGAKSKNRENTCKWIQRKSSKWASLKFWAHCHTNTYACFLSTTNTDYQLLYEPHAHKHIIRWYDVKPSNKLNTHECIRLIWCQTSKWWTWIFHWQRIFSPGLYESDGLYGAGKKIFVNYELHQLILKAFCCCCCYLCHKQW